MKTPKLQTNYIARALLCSAAVLAIGTRAGRAQTAQEYNQLKTTVDAMKQTIDAQTARIVELEKAARAAVPSGTTAAAVASPSQKTVDTIAAGGTVGTVSPVENRGAMNDQQEAASRPGKFVLDTKYRGFFPIPNTPALIKINAKPHLDIITDNKAPGSRHRFVPALFPLEGSPAFVDEVHSTVSANATQLRIDVRAPDLDGNIRFYYQNDFTGDDSRDMRYRLQHIWGTIYGFKAGFTYGVWEDPDSWPDTVDYEGPNAVIFSRRPVAQYTISFTDNLTTTLGVEKPDIFTDLSSGPRPGGVQVSRLPDFGLNVRWEPGDLGHLQASAMVRDIGAKDAAGRVQTVTGYGANLSAVLNIGKAITLMGLAVWGEGVGGMGNDTSFLNADAAFDAQGSLVAMPYYSLHGAATVRFGKAMRSTITYGYVNLDNTNGQTPTFYHESVYASANVIFQLRKQLSVGAEALYGKLKARNNAESGDHYRFQVGMVYSLFD